MELDLLQQVVDIFKQSKINKLSFKKGDLEILLEGEVTTSEKKSISVDTSLKEIKDITLDHIVKSPMVGTFFESASPNGSPFVKLGDMVEEGDILCIVEAMKVMMEVKAERGGIIKEIRVKDGEMIEFGSPLFVMR